MGDTGGGRGLHPPSLHSCHLDTAVSCWGGCICCLQPSQARDANVESCVRRCCAKPFKPPSPGTSACLWGEAGGSAEDRGWGSLPPAASPPPAPGPRSAHGNAGRAGRRLPPAALEVSSFGREHSELSSSQVTPWKVFASVFILSFPP